MILTTQEFVDRSITRHRDRFAYECAKYNGHLNPIEITCRIHGRFQVIAKSHLYTKSGGCPGCLAEILRNARQLSRDQFVARAKEIHGDRYIYDQVDYQGTNVKVTIVCPQHGPFDMRAYRHIEGRGCRLCSHTRLSRERRLSFWEFVEAIVSTHGTHRYDYQIADHVNQNSKIQVCCPIHGWFRQSISAHMQGHGCSDCCQSAGETKVRQALLILEVQFHEQHRFANCRAKRALPFDFYVPSHQLLVEYDGRQHYEQSEHWGGEKKLAQTRHHDAIKTRFAAENGFDLLRIPYWDIDSIDDLVLDAIASTPSISRN